jgi:hypothetical protein
MKKIVENSVEEQIEIKISVEIIHPLSGPFTQQYMMHFHVQDYVHYCALILSVF